MTRQEEFDRIAMPHSRSLLRVATRLTLDSTAAEDLVQESLMQAWRSFYQFRRGTNIRAWLFRILINLFYAQGRKPEAVATLAPLSEALRSQDQLWNSSIALDRESMRRALEDLTMEHRTVLLLGVVEGFSCQEMADILEVPIGTVMSRMSRAREALRDRLCLKEDRYDVQRHR